MPISIKTDLEWGSTWYIKNDPEQLPHLLVGVIIQPSKQFKLIISYMGDTVELYDFEVTNERDEEILKERKTDE